MWYVYVLRFADGFLYSSITQNINKALARHEAGKGGPHTRNRGSFKCIWRRYFDSRAEAMRINSPFRNKNAYEKGVYLASLCGITVYRLRKPDRVDRPSILFVPGYLTHNNQNKQDSFKQWSNPLKTFCSSRKYGLYYLSWESGNYSNLAKDIVKKTLSNAASCYKSGGPYAALAGGASSAAWEVRNHFNKRRNLADKISSDPLPWLAFCHGPVYLVGHSLGGRLILQAAANLKKEDYLAGLVALAPAIKRKDLDLRAISRAIQYSVIIYSSKNDNTLKWFFLGEAIGYTGLKESWKKVRSRNISTFKNNEIGHNDYSEVVESLLKRAIPITTKNYKVKETGRRTTNKKYPV